MNELFFKQPIPNSPYGYPDKHCEDDKTGHPAQTVINKRRTAQFLTPIPQPKKQKGSKQEELLFNELSSKEDRYDSSIINGVRDQVDAWRRLPNPADWRVTPETARLLQHWRSHFFAWWLVSPIWTVVT